MEHEPGTLVTPEYWARRSDTPAYQRVYSLLAQHIPQNYNGIVADIACGGGRLLAKLHARMPKGVLVGTDISQEMLDTAKSHLERKNIPVYMERDPSNPNLSQPGVHLVKDDLLNSLLPDGFSRRTFFTFPELDDANAPNNLNGELISWLVNELKIPPLALDSIRMLLPQLYADKNLSRITRKGGRIIITEYGESAGSGSLIDLVFIDRMKKRFSLVNAALASSNFCEDEKIWADTLYAKIGDINPGMKRGYWLSIAEKL